MRKTAKITCIASIMISSQAFSDQEFPLGPANDLTDGLVKYYCQIDAAQGLQQSQACLDAVKAWAGEEIVAACADEVAKLNASWPGVKYMDMAGGGSWHTGYHKDENGIDHRHDWSDGTRDMAGRTVGTRYVAEAKQNAADVETQKQNSAGKSWTTDGQVTASGKLFGTGVEGSVGHDRGGTSDSSTTVTSKGPSAAELDEAYRKGYKDGYENPQRAGINPDTYCEKGQINCLSSNGSPKNEYPKSDPPPVKAPEKIPSRTSSDDSTNLHETKTVNSPSHSENDSLMAGSPGDDDTKPDTTVATIDDGLNNRSPMQTCVSKSISKKFGKDGIGAKDIDPSNSSKTPTEQKEINNQMLKMGICNEGYWGRDYCIAFNKKQNLGMAPSVHGIYVETSIGSLSSRLPRPIINPGTIELANPDDLAGGGTTFDLEGFHVPSWRH